MPIAFTKYVDITSGVGAGAVVATRELMGRLFTTNPLLPPQSFIEFENADDVGSYFGFSSVEYLRAVFYFGWISKNITAPRKISFARWVDAAVAPRVYGDSDTYTLSNFTSVSAGSIGITMGEFTTELTAIDLSSAASLSDVAAAVQTAIRAYTAGGSLFTGATVTYDATRKSFNLVGGTTGAANMVITAGETGTDLSSRLGWLTGSIQADGSAAETVTETLVGSAQASDNFGSFLFIPALTDDQVEEAATWNSGQNVKFIYCVPALAADAQDYFDLLQNLAGTAVTLSMTSGEYPEQVPMMILAATRYDRVNSVQNYMFQSFNLTPSVTTTTDSDAYDALRVNYYGNTQSAGQTINFYQRGLLMGLATAPLDQNTYANEIWLKDFVGSRIMELLLALSRVSANSTGRSQLMAVIQGCVDRALSNGTISVGKELSNTQKLFITQITNDPLAWQQVQNIGYWFDVVMQPTVVNGQTQYTAVYTLVYSKDDVVRKVEGTHSLI